MKVAKVHITVKNAKHHYGIKVTLFQSACIMGHAGPGPHVAIEAMTTTTGDDAKIRILSHNVTSLHHHLDYIMQQTYDIHFLQEISVQRSNLYDTKTRIKDNNQRCILTGPDPEHLHTTGGV
eukprot:9964704-Karenia_brevis.AAC.1